MKSQLAVWVKIGTGLVVPRTSPKQLEHLWAKRQEEEGATQRPWFHDLQMMCEDDAPCGSMESSDRSQPGWAGAQPCGSWTTGHLWPASPSSSSRQHVRGRPDHTLTRPDDVCGESKAGIAGNSSTAQGSGTTK